MSFFNSLAGGLKSLYRKLPFSGNPEPKKRSDITQPKKVGFQGSTASATAQKVDLPESRSTRARPARQTQTQISSLDDNATPSRVAPTGSLEDYTEFSAEQLDFRLKTTHNQFASRFGYEPPESTILAIATNPNIPDGMIPRLFQVSPETTEKIRGMRPRVEAEKESSDFRKTVEGFGQLARDFIAPWYELPIGGALAMAKNRAGLEEDVEEAEKRLGMEGVSEPGAIASNLAQVAVDIVGAKAIGAMSKAAKGAGVGAKAAKVGLGVTKGIMPVAIALSAADLINQYEKGDLGAEDVAQGIITVVGSAYFAGKGGKWLLNKIPQELRERVVMKLTEETAGIKIPSRGSGKGVPFDEDAIGEHSVRYSAESPGKRRDVTRVSPSEKKVGGKVTPSDYPWVETSKVGVAAKGQEKIGWRVKATNYLDELLAAGEDKPRALGEPKSQKSLVSRIKGALSDPKTKSLKEGDLPYESPYEFLDTPTGFEYHPDMTIEVRTRVLADRFRAEVKAGNKELLPDIADELKLLQKETYRRTTPGYTPPTRRTKPPKDPVHEPKERTTIKQHIEDFRSSVTRSTVDTIRQMGEPGKRMADLIDLVRDEGESKAAKAIAHSMKNWGPLNKTEVDAFVSFLDEGKTPNSYEALQAMLKERNLLDQVATEAAEVLPDFAKRSKFFPHVYDLNDLKVGGKLRNKAVEKLIKSGAAVNEADARHILDAQITTAGRRYGSLDLERVTNLEGWRKDPAKVLPAYYAKAYRRLTEAKYFGSKDEVVKEYIGEIEKLAGSKDADFARKAFEAIVGRDQRQGRENWLGVARAFNTITLMSLSAIANASQKINTALYMSKSGLGSATVDFLKTAKGYRTKEGIAWGKRSGAVLESTMREIESMAGVSGSDTLSGRFLKLVRFTKVERLNRVFGANAGRHYAQRLMNTINSGKASVKKIAKAKSALKELGVNVDNLSDDWLEIASKKMSDITQFRADVQDLPYWWSSPEGKTVFQLKNYAFNQAKFLKKNVIDEAKKGNFRPLLVFATLYPMAGEVVADVHALIKGKERPDNLFDRYVDNMAWVGGFGLLSDMYGSMQYGMSGAVGLVAGPTASAATGAVAATGELVTGKGPTELIRYGVGKVPIAGPILRGRITENRGQTQLLSAGQKQGLTRIRDRSEERTDINQQLTDLVESGDLKGAESFAEAEGMSISESSIERRKREKYLSAVTNSIKTIPDTDPFKAEEMAKSFPEMNEHWRNAIGSDMGYKNRVVEYKKYKNVENMPAEKSLEYRAKWRQTVAIPILSDLASQDDQQAAKAWQAFGEFWQRRNIFLEGKQQTGERTKPMSPDSPKFKDDRLAFEKYITELTAFSPKFGEQISVLPTSLFRR